ncbi:MAG TPA: hypothetical protein VJJ82_01635 [Candidatus Nanoarchaeia archaeon]|nr:hypothetical protein [Candidatus Nanoarchaeia archaeon]
MRGRKDDIRDEFSRVRNEITDSEEEIRRLRMSGLLHFAEIQTLDQFEDELRDFERVTEEIPKADKLHTIHDELHGLRSRLEGFSNEVRMV